MKPYRSPDTPTVADLNAPGGYFNPEYNAKLAKARRARARARKYESERLRGQPHPYPLGTLALHAPECRLMAYDPLVHAFDAPVPCHRREVKP